MKEQFSQTLYKLRTQAGLTNQSLANRANVPESLISGLQNNNRRIGEYQARKLGNALGLHDDSLEDFVLQAIDTCSQKVLQEAFPYPAQLLNHLALQLNRAGIAAENVREITITSDLLASDITLILDDDRRATIETNITFKPTKPLDN
jgi:transcriptional regulator with XRE-family HTH domain